MLSFLYGLSYEINITKCIVYLSSVKLPAAHQNDNTSFCIVLMLSVLCGFVWITRRFCLVQNLFTMQWQCQLTNKMSDFKSLLLQIFPLLFFFFLFSKCGITYIETVGLLCTAVYNLDTVNCSASTFPSTYEKHLETIQINI